MSRQMQQAVRDPVQDCVPVVNTRRHEGMNEGFAGCGVQAFAHLGNTKQVKIGASAGVRHLSRHVESIVKNNTDVTNGRQLLRPLCSRCLPSVGNIPVTTRIIHKLWSPHLSAVSESKKVGHSCLAGQLRPEYDQLAWWPRLGREQEWARVLQELSHCHVVRHDVHLVEKTERHKYFKLTRSLHCLFVLNIKEQQCNFCSRSAHE